MAQEAGLIVKGAGLGAGFVMKGAGMAVLLVLPHRRLHGVPVEGGVAEEVDEAGAGDLARRDDVVFRNALDDGLRGRLAARR